MSDYVSLDYVNNNYILGIGNVSVGRYAADGSWNITVVDGTARTGLQAPDGSLYVVLADGATITGFQHPCGAMWVYQVDTEWFGGITHPCGAVAISQSPYFTNTVRTTVVSGDVDLTLPAPDWEWDDEVQDATPDGTLVYDAVIGDVLTLRRSTTADFAVYEDATWTYLGGSLDTIFDFGADWADGVYYTTMFYTRGSTVSEHDTTEIITIDTTGATLSSPVDTKTGTTTATLSATTAEDNVKVYVVVSTSSTAPSSTQMAAGQTHTGAAGAYAANATKATAGAQGFSATGLTPATAYFAHFMGEDSYGNRGAVITGDGFTTDADELTLSAAQVKLNTSTSGQNYTSVSLVAWDGADVLDTDSYHNPASQNSRITIPATGYYQLFLQAGIQNATANETFELVARVNGSATFLTNAQVTTLLSSNDTTPTVQVLSYPISLTAGDYVEVTIQVQADTSTDLLVSRSYASIVRVG